MPHEHEHHRPEQISVAFLLNLGFTFVEIIGESKIHIFRRFVWI